MVLSLDASWLGSVKTLNEATVSGKITQKPERPAHIELKGSQEERDRLIDGIMKEIRNSVRSGTSRGSNFTEDDVKLEIVEMLQQGIAVDLAVLSEKMQARCDRANRRSSFAVTGIAESVLQQAFEQIKQVVDPVTVVEKAIDDANLEEAAPESGEKGLFTRTLETTITLNEDSPRIRSILQMMLYRLQNSYFAKITDPRGSGYDPMIIQIKIIVDLMTDGQAYLGKLARQIEQLHGCKISMQEMDSAWEEIRQKLSEG
jgi:hypothetical protein